MTWGGIKKGDAVLEVYADRIGGGQRMRTTTGCGRGQLRTQSFRALATLCVHDYCNLNRVCT